MEIQIHGNTNILQSTKRNILLLCILASDNYRFYTDNPGSVKILFIYKLMHATIWKSNNKSISYYSDNKTACRFTEYSHNAACTRCRCAVLADIDHLKNFSSQKTSYYKVLFLFCMMIFPRNVFILKLFLKRILQHSEM